MILFHKLHCLLRLIVLGQFEPTWFCSVKKTLRGRHYSLQQQTPFTNINKVLNPLASHIYLFLRSTTVFLHSLESGYFAESWCFSPMKTLRGRQNSFQKITQFTVLSKLPDPLASNINDCLPQATLSLPCTCEGRFWTEMILLNLKTLWGRHCFRKQQPPFTMTSKVLNHLASNIYHFLRSSTVFLHSLERGYFAENWCSSPMKTLRGRQNSFQKITQFTMLSKLPDPLASNINDCLTQATLSLACTCEGRLWTEMILLNLKTLRGRHCSPKQQPPFTMISKVLNPLASNIYHFLGSATMFLYSLERGYFAESWCSSPMKRLRGGQ
jgi:hypothetical protein